MRQIISFKYFALAIIATAIALPSAAQQPNLTGTWKLNLQKSFLAGEHPNDDYVLTKTIVQSADKITQTEHATHVSSMNIPAPDSTTTVDLIPDGKQHDRNGASAFHSQPPAPVEVVAEWQGGTLLVTELGLVFGAASTIQGRYYLSADGSQLIELIESHNRYGDTTQRLVFDKQP